MSGARHSPIGWPPTSPAEPGPPGTQLAVLASCGTVIGHLSARSSSGTQPWCPIRVLARSLGKRAVDNGRGQPPRWDRRLMSEVDRRADAALLGAPDRTLLK